jgi:dihydroxy-acid dehydratase
VDLSEEELGKRRKTWKAPDNPYKSGVLWKYADQVGAARTGAVTHPGGKAEVECYANV